MRIQLGEIYMDRVTEQKIPYPNCTRKYLLPCLKEYGTDFVDKLSNVFKVAVGIGDIIVTNRKNLVYEKHLFILLDSTIAPIHFLNFMEWIKEQPVYEDDYVYGNMSKSSFHMIVIKFPKKYYQSFHSFKEGKYSEMFSADSLPNFFDNYPEIKQVLVKDHRYKVKFVAKLNSKFKMDGKYAIKPEEWEGELEIPPTDKTDVFNHHLKKT